MAAVQLFYGEVGLKSKVRSQIEEVKPHNALAQLATTAFTSSI
jgi:hypothetical protein